MTDNDESTHWLEPNPIGIILAHFWAQLPTKGRKYGLLVLITDAIWH